MYVTVTFCEYLVFPQDFITKLKLYSAKYLEQESRSFKVPLPPSPPPPPPPPLAPCLANISDLLFR